MIDELSQYLRHTVLCFMLLYSLSFFVRLNMYAGESDIQS